MTLPIGVAIDEDDGFFFFLSILICSSSLCILDVLFFSDLSLLYDRLWSFEISDAYA